MTNENIQGFPLKNLLQIYLQAPICCYVDYMEGFKLLTNWLSPITYIGIDTPQKIPSPLISYETQRISVILEIDAIIIFNTFMQIHQETLTKHEQNIQCQQQQI